MIEWIAAKALTSIIVVCLEVKRLPTITPRRTKIVYIRKL